MAVDMTKLRFVAEAVKENRKVLLEEKNRLDAELKVVHALLTANHQICGHPNIRHYSDGGSCADCGYSY
jgi:hypothetical protein